jgi:hypothetical protein
VTRQLPGWHKSPQSHVSFDCGSRSSEVCQKILTVGSKKSDVRFDSAQQSQPISMKRTTPARCLLWRHNCSGTDKPEFRTAAWDQLIDQSKGCPGMNEELRRHDY